MGFRVRQEMKCPECGLIAGSHDDSCKWSKEVAARYFNTMNLLMAYLSRADVNKLREAQDALSETIAWASAYDADRRGVRGE